MRRRHAAATLWPPGVSRRRGAFPLARRRYTDGDREAALAALAANGGNLKATAAALGIPPKTLRSWRDQGGDFAPHKKEGMAEALDRAAWTLLGALTDKDRIADAPLNQVATSMGIAIDKARLLRGESTNIEEKRHALSTPAADALAPYAAVIAGFLAGAGGGPAAPELRGQPVGGPEAVAQAGALPPP